MQNLKTLLDYLDQADQASHEQSWHVMASASMQLICDACHAEAVMLYLASLPGEKIPWQGQPSQMDEDSWEVFRHDLITILSAPSSEDQAAPGIFERRIAQLLSGDSLSQLPGELAEKARVFGNLLVLPFSFEDCAAEVTPGGFLLINAASPDLALAQRLARRLGPDLDRAARLEISQQRETRLMELNEILGQLGASLDPNQVLRMLIDGARQFLRVEAVSLFLIDDATGELVLQIASQANKKIHLEQLRVPSGKGIIGYVVQTGETVIVEDAHQDERHYGNIDQNSGFKTRSILAVPLHSRRIDLGEERGVSSERIIGGLEAINKMSGRFNQEDAEMLRNLAKGAATILVVAQLYVKSNTLFRDVIQALVAAIDAKDPYTVGHSQRVSDYSIAIARQLELSAEEIYHIGLGSLFHDVGKIGVPDQVLGKTGALQGEELTLIRSHPKIGERIMRKVQLLEEEIPAMAEHHERLDGSGYPEGLHAEQISLSSRIVAVADVFDAMTSDRPYRPGLPVDEVFAYLRKNVGTHFDSRCVEALASAYGEGHIRTQHEIQPS